MNRFQKLLPLSLLVATSVARGQEIPIPDYTLANQGRIGTLITQGVIDRQTTGKPTAELRYTITPALKQQTVAGYVNRLNAKNPVAAQAVATNFGPGKYDYGTIYQGLVKGNGLRDNDAVDAMTAYLVLGYMIVRNIQNDKAVTPAMVQGVRAQIGPALADNPGPKSPTVAGQLGEEMKLQFVLLQGGWQAANRENTLATYRQGVSTLFANQWKLDFTQLSLTNRGFGNAGQAASSANEAPVKAVGAAFAPKSVAGWFFRAVSGYPAAIRFEPVVLFTNGEYFEVGQEPLELLNVNQSKQRQPAAWGRWQQQQGAYLLTNADGKPNTYRLGSGNWFPAYSYAPGFRLKKGYEQVSGGDLGTGTQSLSVTKLTFVDETHFREGLNAGVSSSNAFGGKRQAAGGTYKLAGHTLELRYDTGRVVRTSFAIGATGSPPKPTNTLIFIGGYAYTDTE